MMNGNPEFNWNIHATRILKSEMILAGVSYDQLTKRLAAIGVIESYKGLANKINRGTFTLAFFLQCMHCLQVSVLNLNLNCAYRVTDGSKSAIEH